MRKFTSLKKKLIIRFSLCSILPAILIIVVMYFACAVSIISIKDNRLQDSMKTTNYQFNKIEEKNLSIVSHLALNSEFIDAVNSNNQSEITKYMNSTYSQFKSIYNISVLELGGTDGKVLYRAHNPSKKNDDKSSLTSISEALKGQTVSSFDSGNSGLKMRATIPIKKGQKVIGTLQIGSDSSFVQDIFSSISGHIYIYNTEELLLSSDSENINSLLTSETLKNTYTQFENATTEYINSDLGSNIIFPIYDAKKEKIMGLVQIIQDEEAINEFAAFTNTTSLILLGITIFVSLIVSITLGKSITDPIHRGVENLVRISKGELTLDLLEKDMSRNDDIGLLMHSIQDTKNQLNHLLTSIRVSSGNVMNSSEIMLSACVDVKESSKEVAATVSDFATSREREATKVNDISLLTNDINEEITNLHESFTYSVSLGDQSHNAIKEGQVAIDKHKDSIQSSLRLAKQISQSMTQLSSDFSKITEIVSFINNISRQTNLLALNASIEAARAGEAGRGFSVVAKEIGDLAEQSSSSVENITNIIEKIEESVTSSQQLLKSVDLMVESQQSHTKDTVNAFEHIDEAVKAILANLMKNMEQINAFAENIVVIHNNISSIDESSKEATLHSHELANIADEQFASSSSIADSAHSMNAVAKQLLKEVDSFKLEQEN